MKVSNKYRKLLTLLIFIIFSSIQGNIFAQQAQNDSTNKTNPIPLSEITFKYDELQNILEEISKSAEIPNSIIKIDSNYQKFSTKVDSLGKSLVADSTELSKSRIDYLQKEWTTYEEKLLSWQIEIAEHNRKVEAFKDSLSVKA